MCLIILTTVLGLSTLLTAEPNLPLFTAADTISDLLRDAPDPTFEQYARLLAYGVPTATRIDVLPPDRARLWADDSPLRCILITHGGLLRHILKSNTNLRQYLDTLRVAFNDESQQGGQTGFTITAANLPSDCLQVDRGEVLNAALLNRLSSKAVAFLGAPHYDQWLSSWKVFENTVPYSCLKWRMEKPRGR